MSNKVCGIYSNQWTLKVWTCLPVWSECLNCRTVHFAFRDTVAVSIGLILCMSIFDNIILLLELPQNNTRISRHAPTYVLKSWQEKQGFLPISSIVYTVTLIPLCSRQTLRSIAHEVLRPLSNPFLIRSFSFVLSLCTVAVHAVS
jgi:hypothetical protein